MNIELPTLPINIVIVSSVVGIASCCCILYLLLTIMRYQKAHQKLLYNIKRLYSNKLPSSDINFRNKDIERIWNFLKLVTSNQTQEHSATHVYEEAIMLTEKLAGVSNEKHLTAKELIDLLLGVGPDISAVAVVLRNPKSGTLEIEGFSGLPRERVEEALLTLFDGLLDPLSDPQATSWGYLRAEEEQELVNFTAFDIGLSLVVPLQGTVGTLGGVWIGFKKGSCAPLTPERRTFVQAVVQHAAASFYAAQKASEKTVATEKERELLLGMSHDLRSPANTALYCVTSLLDGTRGHLSEGQRCDLEIIKRSLQNQSSILSDLFDYVKSKSGILKPRRTIVPLNEAITSIIADYGAAIERRGLAFYCEEFPDVQIDVDIKHIRRIVANFLSNAEKYTDAGSVDVKFSLTEDYVEVRVLDTGIGIPNDVDFNALFQQFQRFRNAQGKQGLGLGLSITKVLAESNEGYVKYEPNLPNGSIFTVGILRAENHEIKEPEQKLLNTVVIADDDPGVRNTFTRYLRDISRNLISASSVSKTKILLEQGPVDLLITDMQFGDGTAADLFEIKRSMRPTIICTGATDFYHQFPGLDSFPVIALEKPIARDTLLRAVKELTHRQKV